MGDDRPASQAVAPAHLLSGLIGRQLFRSSVPRQPQASEKPVPHLVSRKAQQLGKATLAIPVELSSPSGEAGWMDRIALQM